MGKLNDKKIQATKSKAKQYGISDGDGLTLIVKPNGSKLWWFRYRFTDNAKTLSLGEYPVITLAEARDRVYAAKKLLADNLDPSQVKQAKKIECRGQAQKEKSEEKTQFEYVAREWFTKFSKSNDWAESHASKVMGRLEKDIFPWLGQRQIGEIEPMELLSVVRRIENRGALETAHRALNECGRIFKYAVASGWAKRDPAADLSGALPAYRKDKHFAAITDPKIIGDLLRDIEAYSGTMVVRCAFSLSPRLFLRPGELRKIEWDWINFNDAMLTIPFHAHKTGKRTKEPHLVPLSHQAIVTLKEIRAVTGSGKYVFPSERDKNRPLSDNGIRSAMRRLGWSGDEMTPHGFRAMASTLLDSMGYDSLWIERQLAHDEPNKVKAAYKRNMYKMYLSDRTKMMQDWSDYLDKLRDAARSSHSISERGGVALFATAPASLR